MMVHINYVAVLVAGMAAWIVGAVWYSALFGKAWMKIMGADKLDKAAIEQMRKDGMTYMAVIFLASLLGAYVLARFIGWLGMTTAVGGMRVAFLAWLGFAVPESLGDAMFSGKDRSLVWPMAGIRIGHYLVGFLVMGAIIGAWLQLKVETRAQKGHALTPGRCGDSVKLRYMLSR